MFLFLILIDTLVILSDIVASWADNHHPILPTAVLYVINSVYFIAFFLRAAAFCGFTEAALKADFRYQNNKTLFFLTGLPLSIACLLAMLSHLTGMIFYIDSEGYSNGPLYNEIVYCVSFYYIGLALIIFMLYRKRLKRRRHRYSILFCNLVILAGMIVRIIFPTYLLMDTFCLIAIFAIYLGFENPDLHLELNGSVFNSRALRDYIDENGEGLNNRCIGVSVLKYYEMRDIYGTAQMDAGLAMIGKYLAGTFEKCLVFYYRKGRFILLGPETMDANRICDEVMERFGKPWKDDNTEVYLEVGFAVADLRNLAYTPDTLLSTLARVLNDVGQKGGNLPMRISPKEFAKTVRDTEIKRCLEQAIEKDLIEVFFQPIVDTAQNKVVGAEALSRIRDDNGDIVSPADFIPIAEAGGYINHVGEQMFEKVCRFMRDNEEALKEIEWINVNLSPIHFLQPNLASNLDSITRKYNVDPERIHLEITEEAMADNEIMLSKAKEIVNLGFRFVLDDYGTGYSNLSRLKKFPFVNIKIDKSIVWDYMENPGLIIPNMIRTFKDMGFTITAEGIEDDNMDETMKKLGCDFHQGFYYSRPIPMEEFLGKYT